MGPGMMIRALSMFAGLCFLAGCPEENLPVENDAPSSDAPVRADAAPPDSQQADAPMPDARPSCNTLTLSGLAERQLTFQPGAAPRGTGGAVEDGTFVLSGMVGYGASLPPVAIGPVRMVLTGNVWQDVGRSFDGERELTSTFHLSTLATQFTLDETCPTTSARVFGSYNWIPATNGQPAQLQLIYTDRGLTVMATWTKES